MPADPRTPHGSAGDPALSRLEEQRLRLQLVATALSQPLDAHDVAVAVLEAAGNVLGAAHGWLALASTDGTFLELLEAVGLDDPLVAERWRVPLAASMPMADAIRSGRALYHSSDAARAAELPLLAAARPGAPETQAAAIVPLVFEGRGIGILGIAFPEQHDFDGDERWFLETLAAHASQAIQRARLFDELREREAGLQSALEASGTGTWDWDLASDVLIWSQEIFRLHGLPVDGNPPSPAEWLTMVVEDDRTRIEAMVRQCLEEGGTYDTEFRVRHPDGRVRWLHSVGRTAAGPDGRPARLLGTTLDITERREEEEERTRQVEAEREAARLRDAFTGVVSHELRTPITTIYGGARVLARRWRDMEPETRDDILADVAGEADRLYRLVEDLLVVTRVERGTLDIGDVPVHLGRIVERVVASERPNWGDVQLVCEVPADLPSVAGEEAYVEQVLRNLLDNAAKYGGAGTTVVVQTEAVGPDVVLRVLDEGPGIDEAEAARLFEIFYRAPSTAAATSGAGIGLFVCRQLVEAMGGTIHAQRRSEQGSAFIVTLPRFADDGAG